MTRLPLWSILYWTWGSVLDVHIILCGITSRDWLTIVLKQNCVYCVVQYEYYVPQLTGERSPASKWEAAGCSPSLLQVVEFLLWLHYCVGQEISNDYVNYNLFACQARNFTECNSMAMQPALPRVTRPFLYLVHLHSMYIVCLRHYYKQITKTGNGMYKIMWVACNMFKWPQGRHLVNFNEFMTKICRRSFYSIWSYMYVHEKFRSRPTVQRYRPTG